MPLLTRESMKIYYVLYSGQVGGAEQHYLDLASGMVRRGHVVTSLMPDGPVADKSRQMGIEVINIYPKLDIDPVFIYRALAIFRQNKPDVVHTLQLKTNVNGLIAASLARVPVKVGHLLGSLIDWEVPIWKTIPNVVANTLVMNLGATDVMALSPAVARTLHEKEKILKSKIRVIPASINVAFFRNAVNKDLIKTSLKLGPKTILIGSVGRLTVEKGHRYFVEAAPKIHRLVPNAHLVLIGDGKERANLEDLINKLKVGAFVHLLGLQSEENKQSMLKELDVFVFPSIREGFGIAMVEAMAAGTVVVASGLPEIKAVVGPDEAIFFNPRDSQDLAQKIRVLLSDEKLQYKLSQNAYRKVKNTYSYRIILEQYEDLYLSR